MENGQFKGWRDIGWSEHLLRFIGGFFQKLFTGRDTLSPDSHDSPLWQVRFDMAAAETKALFDNATSALSGGQPSSTSRGSEASWSGANFGSCGIVDSGMPFYRNMVR
jgi:hypothetical protein